MSQASIAVDTARIISHEAFGGEQYIIRLASEKIASRTLPGQFVHLKVGDTLPMRRPISIMQVDTANNTFDLLYKVVGEGTAELAKRTVGEELSVMGPIGNGFSLTDKTIPILLGGGVGMPPMIALSQVLKDNSAYHPFVVLASEVDFPFVSELCSGSATMPLLNSWGVRHQLASLQGYQGVFNGYATDAARAFLDTLGDDITKVEIYGCGPEPMLHAIKHLASEYNVPAQLSLEEYMACAVGGCAGCTVQTLENGRAYMRKVCVEGPVFDSAVVFN